MGRRGRAKNRDIERHEAQQQRKMQAQFVAAQLSYWSGPTPSPDVLREYELIVPGAADRIIAMANVRPNTDRNWRPLLLRVAAPEPRLARPSASCWA